MQDNFRALGADSSPLSLQPADRVKRLLAHIIDGLVVLVPMFIGMPFLIFAGASGAIRASGTFVNGSGQSDYEGTICTP